MRTNERRTERESEEEEMTMKMEKKKTEKKKKKEERARRPSSSVHLVCDINLCFGSHCERWTEFKGFGNSNNNKSNSNNIETTGSDARYRGTSQRHKERMEGRKKLSRTDSFFIEFCTLGTVETGKGIEQKKKIKIKRNRNRAKR